ncbi:MAG: HAMP domain-containing histidine kinase [Oscillospiraceae bacterium]|nr:HAMP domain-containing histidine kinase [Oscillospiraceae bacterium]
MDKEIKHLRKKFFILSSSIAFVIIFIMLLVLNVLMHMTYQNELKTATDMVTQTACSNVMDINTEVIYLKDTETNDNGDHIILRDPGLIKSITLNGEITCTDINAEWYCAGGGIYFEFIDEHDNAKYIHKEYKFNQGNTKITVDFTNNSDFICDDKPIVTDISKASQDRFWISIVWWAISSNSQNTNNPDVKLNIDSIEIQYTENISAASSQSFEIQKRDFKDIYLSGTPQTLSNFSCFYFITDKKDNLVEINEGNISRKVSEEDIDSYIKNTYKSDFMIDNIKYTHHLTETDYFKIHVFIHSTQAEKNSRQLLLMSVLSGSSVFVLLLILIYIISGRAVKPISESYKKQKEFISNASHELKTPITVITATSELMEKKNGSDRLVNCIKIQSQKMSRLVNDMLTFSRLSNHEKQSDDFKKFDMSNVVRNTALYFESRAFEERKQIISNIQENISFTGNQNKIDELIGILLDNALKYSDENSQIKLNLYSEKENIILTCQNQCMNFNTDDIPFLFERFYRGDKSHSKETEGFGLGLSIAKEIVLLHKGNITVNYKNKIVYFHIKF